MMDFFLFFIIIIFAGIAYFSTRFFSRFTQKSKYHTALDALVFIFTLALCLLISFLIFINTVTFER